MTLAKGFGLRISIFCWFLIIPFGQLSHAKPLNLGFAVNSPGSPPFLYFDVRTNAYLGVIPDLLAQAVSMGELEVKYIDSNRIRSEMFLYAGKADAFLSSSDWLAAPEKLIQSDNLLLHKSFLYSVHPFAADFKISDLTGKHICARRGYTYPALEELFERELILRVDSTSQRTMTEMLIKGRCDVAIMNEFNAQTIFAHKDFDGVKFYQSAGPTNIVQLALFFRPELTAQRKLINTHLRKFKHSGELDKSLKFHAQNARQLALLK